MLPAYLDRESSEFSCGGEGQCFLPTWTANLANSLVVAKDGEHQAAIRLRLQSGRILKYEKIHGPNS
jgi:hypothetical protein